MERYPHYINKGVGVKIILIVQIISVDLYTYNAHLFEVVDFTCLFELYSMLPLVCKVIIYRNYTSYSSQVEPNKII